jgi:hypothetical protein
MRTVFADTYFFFALMNRRDEAYEAARAFAERFDGRLLTTTWVLTEVADGMADPLNRGAFVAFLAELQTDPQVEIVAAGQALWERGVALYAARQDKAWSLTDCISIVVMEERGIREALTGDHHFEQAGFGALLKPPP